MGIANCLVSPKRKAHMDKIYSYSTYTEDATDPAGILQCNPIQLLSTNQSDCSI